MIKTHKEGVGCTFQCCSPFRRKLLRGDTRKNINIIDSFDSVLRRPGLLSSIFYRYMWIAAYCFRYVMNVNTFSLLRSTIFSKVFTTQSKALNLLSRTRLTSPTIIVYDDKYICTGKDRSNIVGKILIRSNQNKRVTRQKESITITIEALRQYSNDGIYH